MIDGSDLNQAGFAKSIGIDRSTLSQLLSQSHLRLPRADTVAAIAERYQVSIDWLLGLTDQGRFAPDMLDGPLEFEDFKDSSINAKMLAWYKEAESYRVRYIPSTLPDLFKTEAVASHEFQRYGFGRTEQSIRDTHKMLVHQRHEHSEVDCCQSIQEVAGFARGEGIWQGLPAKIRRDQLEHMQALVAELYPNFRWYLFDERAAYTAAFTVFGPLRVAVFIGQVYLVLNGRDHIRRFSRRFDELIRIATVQPNEVSAFIEKQLARL